MSRCRSEPRLTEKHSGSFSHLLIGSPFDGLWDWLWFASQSASKTEKAGSFDSLSDAIDASKPLKSMIEVKQLGKNFMKSNWKKYWAVLQNNSLYIYYDKTETAMVQVRIQSSPDGGIIRDPRTRAFDSGTTLNVHLRVVETQVILFCKSMSEKVGSDPERLWNWISRSIQIDLKMTSFKFRVVLCRIRLFPTMISKVKWLGSKLPLSYFWSFLDA